MCIDISGYFSEETVSGFIFLRYYWNQLSRVPSIFLVSEDSKKEMLTMSRMKNMNTCDACASFFDMHVF